MLTLKTYNYTVDKVGSYRYYKLDVKAGYGSSVQLSEISLKGAYISQVNMIFCLQAIGKM